MDGSCPDQVDGLSIRCEQAGSGAVVRVIMAGTLDISGVETLAACADRLCAGPARSVRIDLAGLRALDEPGARNLVVACNCLRLHGCVVTVTGIGRDIEAVLGSLGLDLSAVGHRAGTRTGSSAPPPSPGSAAAVKTS